MSEYKVCFVTYGPRTFASSRLRGYWISERMSDAVAIDYQEAVKHGTFPDAEIYVLQKAGDAHVTSVLRGMGRKVIYDACDPVHWFTPDQARAMLENVDHLTFSTAALRDDWMKWYGQDMPTTVIPDRLNLDHYQIQRQHADVSPVRFIWYGIGYNRVSLAGAWVNLLRLVKNGRDIELTIYDDVPGKAFMLPAEDLRVSYAKWTLPLENETIAAHDIAILPPFPGPWGKLKSDNKHQTAWACGVPAVTGMSYDALLALTSSHQMRRKVAAAGLESMTGIEKSVEQWEALCASL